ncbi:MAG: hypothetical protein HN742_38280 [Lentisphaerae bacterium]|jgi:hypothetical protein|nr:hypothetical protein [Lentisphaerota bacterium]MBT4817059.1 hypothetical protein [Lentisphaerota bacterium]MBT5609314.1 hypothetical protein [Lentisphaerota bacterium]MBT7059392.1 hypothetical protein [Lentisphaerota bacterium]MBT7847776.1 hypothetical protein [Lentisphaerota bacterium]
MANRAQSNRCPPTFTCPHCGAEVRAGALACQACGSDAETGWTVHGDVGPSGYAGDADFDYDDFVRREFGGDGKRWLGYSRQQWQAIIASLLALAFLYLMLR